MKLELKMMKLGLGLGILLLLNLVAGSKFIEKSPNFSNKKEDNCSYTIIIETSCMKGAGTTNPVSIRFGDSNSTDVLARQLITKHVNRPNDVDDVPVKPFQECAKDVFQVTGRCIKSQVCYMYLKRRGGDDWRPGRAQVLVSDTPEFSSSSFYFRRVIPREVWHGHDMCAGEVTPFGVRKARKVYVGKHGLKEP